jgi:flavin-dependent dehydrogenase
MTDEGWFWLIGLNERVTSIGFVCHPDFIKQVGVPPTACCSGRGACPSSATACATPPARRPTGARGFSYTCKPIAGDGYFMVGDAGCFLDPIFSTGVTLPR